MRRKKLNPVRRRRRSSFEKALDDAKERHVTAVEERAVALSRLQELNVEIPNLERTCRALEAQLNGKGSTGPDSRPTSQGVSKQVGGVLPDKVHIRPTLDAADIPPEVLAQLPPEDFSKFGSHFGAEAPESEDFLPEITGKELVPEKK